MFDPWTLSLVLAIFLVAGIVKGLIGLGLPTIVVALVTVAIDLPTAMAVLIVPSLLANVWQAAVGGHTVTLVRRLWPFLLCAAITVWLGAAALSRVDVAWLSALLGVLLAVHAATGLVGLSFDIKSTQQWWAGPAFGFVNGVFTGMTGSFVVPGVMYLQAVGLGRDALVQAMGMLFLVSTAALAWALHSLGLLGVQYGALSALGVLPAFVGIWIGQRLRRRLSEPVFRRVLLICLLLLGIYIVARSLG